MTKMEEASTFELSVNEEDAKEVKFHFEEHGYHGLFDLLVKKRDQWVDTPIHVAISGSSGVGKSTFINTIRGITAEDKIGAALNVGQTTIEPIPYSHPKKHYLKFWDLPQLGSRAFSKDLYLTNIKVERYDYFLIFGKGNFTEDDFWFASQLQSMNSKFYFVCTHLDKIVNKALEDNRQLDPKDVQNSTLTAVRTRLIRAVKDNKIKVEYVYLITAADSKKYDFPKLADAMIGDLAERKWEAMALTLHVYAQGVMHQKRRALQKRVWIIALMSGLEKANHIYGLSFDLDLEPVINEVQEYRRQFAFDEASILKFARSLDTTVESLKRASAFKANYSQLADGGLLNQYKTLSVYSDVADGIIKSFSPILGNLISGNSCFGATYHVLNRLLDMMETDALRMIEYVKYRNSEL